MPVLKNARHERFAQNLAKCMTADSAYAEAGYRPNSQHASRLAAKSYIRARLAELQGSSAKQITDVRDAARQHTLAALATAHRDSSLTIGGAGILLFGGGRFRLHGFQPSHDGPLGRLLGVESAELALQLSAGLD